MNTSKTYILVVHKDQCGSIDYNWFENEEEFANFVKKELGQDILAICRGESFNVNINVELVPAP